jgi:hypothetical protein
MVLERILASLAVLVVLTASMSARAQVFIGPRDVLVANVRSVENPTTLVLDTGQRVELLGVAWFRPSRHPELAAAFADAGTRYARTLLEGKRVYMYFEKQRYDLEGSLIAYVFLMKDGLPVNAEIIKQGYALAFGGYYSNAANYSRLQRAARQSNAGLWARLPRALATEATVASTQPRVGKSAPAQPADVAELTTLDLRPSKPFVAAGTTNALNNQRPGGGPVIAMPLQDGAQLFIGGGPTNVGRVTQAVRRKVNQANPSNR